MPATAAATATAGESSTASATNSRPPSTTALTVDTTSANNNYQQQQQQQRSSSTTSFTERGVNPSPAQDSHPYARGSVIEVWHYPKQEKKEGDDWWSESSEEDENDDSENANDQTTTTTKHRTLRLCDIIDRSTSGPPWRYYVHYRDFNRRMDEWITVDRIAAPPSVGNAKARALKKQQEAQQKELMKRKLQQQFNTSEGAAAAAAAAAATAASTVTAVAAASAGDALPRTSRRRSSAVPPEMLEGESIPARRRRRRKTLDQDSGAGDAAAVVALNDDEGATTGTTTGTKDLDKTSSVVPSSEQVVTVVSLATSSSDVVVTTHTVGEHVVATVEAQEMDEHEGLDEASLREHEEVTKIKTVRFLQLGEFQMETWYFSPLPKDLLGDANFLPILYVCEFTLRMFARKSELQRHQSRISGNRHPPGNEIYRKGNLSMFEVDGMQEKIYCQNLCYLAKLFLDHKTLYYDVDPFLFYVLCEVDNRGFHPVGYYSKEKYSDVGYNLACILTFPAHQRKGYGRFLIAFSYELTKKEEKVGSPEKPMSDLGQQAYKPYWASTIVDFLLNQSDDTSLSIIDIAKRTSIMADDIIFTLNHLGLLKIINGVYFIMAEKTHLTGLAKKYPIKEPRVDPTHLHWIPFITDVKRDKFSIHSKKPSVEQEDRS